jgi:hypothetical protein
MIDLFYRGLQCLGLLVIGGGFALIYIHLKRVQEKEWEKRDDEMLKMLSRRKTDNVDEATTGHNIRGCEPNHHGKRD